MTDKRDWEHTTMARLCAGDGAALGELYDQFGGFVFGLARRITSDTDLAQEVTQEVFCYLWQHPDRFDGARGSVRGFLGTLAHRRAVDLVRSTESIRRTATRHAAQRTLTPPDIAERVDAYLQAEDVRSAVAELPEEQRVPILLAYFEGYSYRQLAELLGIPEGTAKSRIRRALARLNASLTSGTAP